MKKETCISSSPEACDRLSHSGTARELVYINYWKRKNLLNKLPVFPILQWWDTVELSQIERFILNKIQHREAILDVGAGDLRLMQKFQKFGYTGQYHTQDIGGEETYTYQSLSEVKRQYPAIICWDVIEHLTLEEGLSLLNKLVSLLESDGILLLHTPNARSIKNIFYWDMTHLHGYNLPDLWAYLTCLKLEVEGYRVVFTNKRYSFFGKVNFLFSRYLIAKVLGCDYADGIFLLARKPQALRAGN